MSNPMLLRENIRTVPDWPEKGIMFRDISPILASESLLHLAILEMRDWASSFFFEKIVAIDARGFVFGAPLTLMGKGFVMARKKGKLPPPVVSCEYGLEYGKSEISIACNTIHPGDRVLIVDDVLATGGTAEAVATVVKELGGQVMGMLFFMELMYLPGREVLKNYQIRSVVQID